MATKFLTAEWRKLPIINYAVDPAVLLPSLPYKTELDEWQGMHYISLVGFRFINTRLRGIPVPFHRHFEEVNLRFYVRYKEGNEWRRGVSFIREIVPRRALSFVANTLYNEKYITRKMRHQWQASQGVLQVSYSWLHGQKWNSFSVAAAETPAHMLTGSAEEFITEHYWGYTPVSNNQSSEYGVEHPRWQVYPVIDHAIDVDFAGTYGEKFRFLDSSQPQSVMLAEGSEIVVRGMRRIL